MAGDRVFNFHGNVTFNDIHDNHHCTIIVPKGKTEDDAEENQEPLHTTPFENDYVAVVKWLEEEKRRGTDWYKLNNNNRTAMCRQLSQQFGWTVDQNSLGKAQKRTN